MGKKFKIIIGVVITFIVIVVLGVVISALIAPQGIEMDGKTFYVGDIVHTEKETEGPKGMVITQINPEDNSFISESTDSKYKMKWDTTTGIGIFLVIDGEINPYAPY